MQSWIDDCTPHGGSYYNEAVLPPVSGHGEHGEGACVAYRLVAFRLLLCDEEARSDRANLRSALDLPPEERVLPVLFVSVLTSEPRVRYPHQFLAFTLFA